MLALLLALSAHATPGALPEDGATGTDRHDPVDPEADAPHTIIHGEPATLDDFPQTGGLLASGSAFGIEQRLLMCSSTLIAPDVVLAAAHCVDLAAMAEEYGITVEDLGYTFSREVDLSRFQLSLDQLPDWPADAVHAWDWVRHPGWDMAALEMGLAENDDIALIFLEEPLLDVPHAYLPEPADVDQVQVEAEVAVVGWGQQTANAQTSPVGEKRWGMSWISELAPYEFQVGLEEADVRKCHGDSGGPSFLWVETEALDDMRLVGVTSHSYDESDCAETGGVDTRVDHYLDWIDAEMRARCESGERAWCEVEGIVPPPYPVVDTGGDTGDGGGEEPRACGCAAAPVAMGWLVVVPAVLVARRRRR